MGKRLRLAAAGLTDIGRRRERNQDNTTHRVPTDEAELARKGALFVVCDGMGGHAAGEVAAEIGVETIRDAYFATTTTDVIDNLADAIRAANEGIFDYAGEHPELTGMGTTCVTLLIHGGRAYFVNIGDSRAYLARNGKLRQVTLDHSWVAEQVRAGVLTEEQARTHAHRNVITRSLGTQPNVNADLFIEKLQEGDRILLCSDGLHGYVDEDAIERAVLQNPQPDDSVQSLVDMANENGGPDNITAVLVQLLEVPEITDTLSLPDATTSPDGAITQPLPIYSSPRMPAVKRTAAASARPAASGAKTKPVKVRAERSRGAKVALNAVRLLAVAAVIAIGIGVWDFTNGPYAVSRAAATQAQHDISSARQTIQAAQSQEPAQALAALSSAQQRLTGDLHNAQLDATDLANVQTALTTELTPAVQNALTRYNATNSIKLVSSTGMTTYSVTCASATVPGATPAPLSNVSGFTAVQEPATKAGAPLPATQTLYALSGGSLYQIITALDGDGAPTAAGVSCFPIALPGTTGALAIAADGASLYALVSLVNSSTQVIAIQPDGTNTDGSPKIKTQALVNVPVAAGQTPGALAVSGGTAYVAFTGTGGPGVWQIVKGAKTAAPVITLPQAATSLAATPTRIFALLSDGTLGYSATDSPHFAAFSTHAQPPASTESPNSYSGGAVPMPDASVTSAFGASATLALDPALPTQTLVGDPMRSRILRLTPGASTSVMLDDQYVYGHPLTHPGLFAVSTVGALLDMYVWNGSDLLGFSVAEPAA